MFADPFRKEQSIFDVAKFVNTINDNAELFDGDIYIGRRDGFWEEYDELLTAMASGSRSLNGDESNKSNNENDETNKRKTNIKSLVKIHYDSVNKIIDDFCNSIKLEKDEIL